MTRTVSFDDVLAEESPELREAIKTRSAELLEQYTLRRLREAAGLSQDELAKKSGLTQNRVSRIERGEDMRLSTLSRALEGMGGSLQLVAKLRGKEIPFSVSSKGAITGTARRTVAKPAAKPAKTTASRSAKTAAAGLGRAK